jgi:hypothetical protein
MSGAKKVARNLLVQEPGRVDCHALAADTRTIPHRKPARHYSGSAYLVKTTSDDTFPIVVSGRVRWALDQLRKAGTAGCTPIDSPAPRWSAYIFELRGIGVEIDTLHEPHTGEFSGTHGRYVLRSTVTRTAKGGAV